MRPLIGSVYFGLARFSSAGEPVAEASVAVGKKTWASMDVTKR